MKKPKICIICSEILGYDKIGGFGSMAKELALSLSKEGYEVVVAVPKKRGQNCFDKMNGFTVLRLSLLEMLSKKIFEKIDADIYHSQNQTLMTLVAELAQPDKKHIVTCRDPRDLKDWFIEFLNATWRRKLKIPLSYIFEESPPIRWAIKKADVVGCPAYFLQDKIQKMYHLNKKPIFLPNIEDIPKKIPKKSKKPTVCFVGRLAKRKRPEVFFKLANKFPHVDFLILGTSEEKSRQSFLELMAKSYKNVKMLGFIDKFSSDKLYDVYNKSWILINTSAREGLPLTFVEAAGRGCAILSYVNPDNFASEFGYWAKDGDFETGLRYLLKNNNWKRKGKIGHKYVYSKYRREKALAVHLNLYNKLLKEVNT